VIISRPMPGILGALVAFVREQRRCGELNGNVERGRVWMAWACGADVVHPVERSSREQSDCG
jgi:hypothetical protein